MITHIQDLLAPIRRLHEQIRTAVVTACEQSALDDMASIAREEAGDTIYAVDKISEDLKTSIFVRVASFMN